MKNYLLASEIKTNISGINVNHSINWRAWCVMAGNFMDRKDLRTCSLLECNNPYAFKPYTSFNNYENK